MFEESKLARINELEAKLNESLTKEQSDLKDKLRKDKKELYSLLDQSSETLKSHDLYKTKDAVKKEINKVTKEIHDIDCTVLSKEEIKERDTLRKEYIEAYRANLKQHLDHIEDAKKLTDEEAEQRIKEIDEAEKKALEETNKQFEGELS